ncbi:MAG: hypothetical protein WKF66_11565 [Pedobacter sp.]
MKVNCLLLLLLIPKLAPAQSFKYPSAPEQGRTIKSLLPAQWKVIDSIKGDLNNDKSEDMALVLEFYAAVKESRAYGDNDTEIVKELQKPRMLAIYFKQGKNYKLALQNNNFILRSEEGGALGDPLRPMAIKANTLVLNYEGGSGWQWKLSYAFKHIGGAWQLINAVNLSFQDGSDQMIKNEYDFLNHKRKVTIGKTTNHDTANQTEEHALTGLKPRTFATFKKPWTWEIRPGEFL